jgi:hypothetical protein
MAGMGRSARSVCQLNEKASHSVRVPDVALLLPGLGHRAAFEDSSNLLGSFDHGPITSLPARVAREVPMYRELIARAGVKKL